MRKLLICAAALVAPMLATPASAQPWGYGYNNGYGYNYRDNDRADRIQRECNRELSRAYDRREYYRIREQCQRRVAEARRHEWRRDYRDRDDRYGYGNYGYGNYGNRW